MKKIIAFITVIAIILCIPVFAYANSTVIEISDADVFKRDNLTGNTLVFPEVKGTDTLFRITDTALDRFYKDGEIKYYCFSWGTMSVLTDKNNYYDFNIKNIEFSVKENSFSVTFNYDSGLNTVLTETRLVNKYTLNDETLASNTKIIFGETEVNTKGSVDGVLSFETKCVGAFRTDVFEFADVNDSTKWYYNYINSAGATGIMNGVGDGKFDPVKNITRAEICAMIVKATSDIISYRMDGTLSFSDVQNGKWYYDYVMKCASMGIVNGVGDGKFNPTANATRQEVATMTVRLLKLIGSYNGQVIPTVNKDTLESELSALYPDAKNIADFARESVIICSKLNIMVGDGSGFRPKSSIMRCECAKIFFLIYDSILEIKQL